MRLRRPAGILGAGGKLNFLATVERSDSGVDGRLLGHDGSEEAPVYLNRTGVRG